MGLQLVDSAIFDQSPACMFDLSNCCPIIFCYCVQASLDAKTKATKRAEQAALQKAENVEHELAAARRECERAAGDAEDRKVQLSVLVETVETLQAGTPGPKQLMPNPVPLKYIN